MSWMKGCNENTDDDKFIVQIRCLTDYHHKMGLSLVVFLNRRSIELCFMDLLPQLNLVYVFHNSFFEWKVVFMESHCVVTGLLACTYIILPNSIQNSFLFFQISSRIF